MPLKGSTSSERPAGRTRVGQTCRARVQANLPKLHGLIRECRDATSRLVDVQAQAWVILSGWREIRAALENS